VDFGQVETMAEILKQDGLQEMIWINDVPAVYLKGFCNLTSLELYSLYGSETHLTKDICSILLDSPGLENLGLSLSLDLYLEGGDGLGGVESFFQHLCVMYGSLSPSPLALKTLRLGAGIVLWKWASDTSDAHYLLKMIRLGKLEKLHLYNNMVFISNSNVPFLPEIDFSAFTFQRCPALRQFSVHELTPEISEWLITVCT